MILILSSNNYKILYQFPNQNKSLYALCSIITYINKLPAR